MAETQSNIGMSLLSVCDRSLARGKHILGYSLGGGKEGKQIFVFMQLTTPISINGGPVNSCDKTIRKIRPKDIESAWQLPATKRPDRTRLITRNA